MLRNVLRTLFPAHKHSKVIKLGPRSPQLAEIAARPPPLDASTKAALEAVRANVGRRTDAPHNPVFPTVGKHFHSASSHDSKLQQLTALVRWTSAKSILEIGTGYGISAIAMGKAQITPNLITIEVSEPQITIAKQVLSNAFPAGGVQLLSGDKNALLPGLAAEGHLFDFVFHDGGHNGEAYVRDFEALSPMITAGTVYVVDDIKWDDRRPERRRRTTGSQRTCYEGWLAIANDPRTSDAIESGNIGVLLRN